MQPRRLTMCALLIVIGLAAARPLAQQIVDPSAPMFFEAASVRQNKSGDLAQNVRRAPGGRLTATNMPLRALITFAYQLQQAQLVGGPGWITSDRFDIVAKMEGDPAPVPPGGGPDPLMLAMRSLLADRFKLVTHKETRDLDVYALVLAKPGGKPSPALKPVDHRLRSADVRSAGVARRQPRSAQTIPSYAGCAARTAAFRSADSRYRSSRADCRDRLAGSCSIAPASPAAGTSS